MKPISGVHGCSEDLFIILEMEFEMVDCLFSMTLSFTSFLSASSNSWRTNAAGSIVPGGSPIPENHRSFWTPSFTSMLHQPKISSTTL